MRGAEEQPFCIIGNTHRRREFDVMAHAVRGALYKIYKKQFESNFQFVAAVECSAKALTDLLSADII